MNSLRKVKIGEVSSFLNGGTPSKTVDRYFQGVIPWITGADITSSVVTSARSFITEEAVRSSATNQVPAGTILLVTRTSVGKVATAGVDLCFSQDITALTPDKTRVDTNYLVQYLRSQVAYFAQQARGATIKGITRQVVSDLEMPLPPLPEQCRISAVLDKAEELRAKRREALAMFDEFNHAIFLEMFGDPGTNGMNWPRKSLKALGKVATGGTPPSAKVGMFDGPIPFVTPGDLESDALVKRSLTVAGAAESVTVRSGTTLVCCIGATIGKIAMASDRCAFNQQINSVEWADDVDDMYGFHALRFFKPTIIAWGASTTLPILKKSSFERIEIPVPPIPLQREFAKRAKSVESLRKVHKNSLEHMDELFIALQQRAFKGEL